MYSSQKRKRSHSAVPQLKHDFQVLNSHDPWRASSQHNLSHHNHQVTPRHNHAQGGTSDYKVFSTPQTLPSSHDRSRYYHNGNFKDVDNASRYLDSNPSEIPPSSQKSPKHVKKKDKEHRAQFVPASSPFIPDATSTPNHSHRTKPVPVPIPIDPRLNENYINAQAEVIRQRARETKASETFTSHISSSSSASESSDSESSTDSSSSEDEVSSSGESDGTPSPKPKKSKSKKTESKSKKPAKDVASSDKHSKRDKKKAKEGSRDSTQIPVKDTTKKSKPKSDEKKEKTASPPTTKSLPTTKQTNQTLESNLFTTLTTIIPPYLISQARTTLTTEVQSKAKTSHEATPYTGNSSGPSDRAVTLRAAHDLLVRLSVQRFIHGSANGDGRVNMEGDLGRIAAERGKRIELLEMENRGLKSQIERKMGQVDGVDDGAGKVKTGDGNGSEDEDEGKREKKKRRKK